MRRCSICLISVLCAVVFHASYIPVTSASEKEITIGSKNFTEQYIIGQMMKQLLENHGFKVSLIADLTSMALRAAMESRDIDLCAEYTGTAWMIDLKREHKPGITNNELYEKVKTEDSKNDFRWLQPIWNNNTYALASWSSFAEKHNIDTISELADLYILKKGKISTFINFEFSTRPDGLSSLEKYYNFKVARSSLKTGTPGVSLMALKSHKAQVAMVFGTDASLAKFDWHVFHDDKSFFPPYDLTPYINKEKFQKYPEIETILNTLVKTFPGGRGKVDSETIAECQKIWRELNAKVDIDLEEPSDVARQYLLSHGLLKE